MATSQDFVNWICGDELDPEFLRYLFLAEGAGLLRFASGSVHQTIYFPEVKAFHVCIPTRTEQRRIVAILDQAFEGIATAKVNADRCLRNAQSLARSRIDSVFTNSSQTWPESPLESVADFVNGYAFKSADFGVMSGVRSIKITNVGVGQFVAGEDNRLPAHFAQTHAASMAKAGSIVLALTRTIIAGGVKVAVVPQAYDGALVNQRVAAIAPREQMLLTPFLFLFLSSQRVAQYVKDRVNTLMQPNLSITDLRTLQVPIPALSEQRVLMHQLAEFQCEARRLEHVYARKLAALDELKKSLLHRAFTGAL